MFEMGHFRKSALVSAMSAFPPLATKLRTSLEVRFVPDPDMPETSYTQKKPPGGGSQIHTL